MDSNSVIRNMHQTTWGLENLRAEKLFSNTLENV